MYMSASLIPTSNIAIKAIITLIQTLTSNFQKPIIVIISLHGNKFTLKSVPGSGSQADKQTHYIDKANHVDLASLSDSVSLWSCQLVGCAVETYPLVIQKGRYSIALVDEALSRMG